jgi:hypothetical protein
VTDDPVLSAIQRFIDGVRTALAKQADEMRSLLTETRAALTELQTRSSQPVPRGERGEQGERGERGDAGPPGEPGPQGPAGAPGERGADGINGINGRDGAPGAQGERGADGLMGPQGPMGERGADGLSGRDGAPGPQGERGERGADGIATRAELDARIEARFAELQVRTFADVYQGVFEPDKVYARGLLTTWGGSLWLSLARHAIEAGREWRLEARGEARRGWAQIMADLVTLPELKTYLGDVHHERR